MDDSPDRDEDPADSTPSGADADGSDEYRDAEKPAESGNKRGDDENDTEPGDDENGVERSDEGDDSGDDIESSEGDDRDSVEEDDAESEDDGDDAESEDDDIARTADESAVVGDTDDTVTDTSTQTSIDADDEATATSVDEGGFEGPESDEEMPLADHIEEMVQRLAIVLGVAGVVTLIAYPASSFLIEFLWQSYIPDPNMNRPHIYGPLEYILAKLKVAGISGTIVGLPVFVYQTYRFMRPGLYSDERRYYLASVPTSLVLALIGVVFAHLVILPLTMVYFTSYTADAAVVAFGLQETFNLIVVMMGYMAIVFQIPLFIMLAIMMGLVSRQWMEDKRILFWGAFGGLAFTFVSVDPTGMAPIIIAITMIVLFEGTLLLLRWTGN